jgi:hypothetical protein
MKEYKLKLPQRLLPKYQEICEYILLQHYDSGIFSSSACACLLKIEKYSMQRKIWNREK